jgi:2-polyprenyl-6-methoxyphenol hydroxylase-like FAD-dependent oxidoreductase
METFDVVVVGAGPVGLTLAIDLGRRGVRTLLVERDPTTKPWPKMDRSNARTMEFYRRLGIADQVRLLGYPPEASMDVFIVTHLKDPPLARLHYPTVAECRDKIARCNDGSEPLEPYQLVSQNRLEPLLKEVAERTPNLTVRYGCELTDFEQDEGGVTASFMQNGGDGSARSAYLVGCDGGTSTVRKRLGIKLEGQGGIRATRQVFFRSERLYDLIPIGKGRHYYVADDKGSAFVVQGDRKEFTLNVALPEGADVEQEVRYRVGFDFDFKLLNVSNWKLHLLLAERYRDRRVLLAGDAVHLVIPTGGLGMNTGVGDAFDLSWKLAGTLAGWGGPGLLDSYEWERRKVGARNVKASGWAAAGMGMWRALWRPEVTEDSSAGAELRAEIGRMADQHHRRVHEMIGVELGYSYHGSAIIASENHDDSDWDTTKYTPHARPGVRIPHMWLKDGQAIQDVIGTGYTLIDLTGEEDVRELEQAFRDLGSPLQILRLEEPRLREVYGSPLLMLRPDMHVAWRGSALEGRGQALARLVTGNLDTAAAARNEVREVAG